MDIQWTSVFKHEKLKEWYLFYMSDATLGCFVKYVVVSAVCDQCMCVFVVGLGPSSLRACWWTIHLDQLRSASCRPPPEYSIFQSPRRSPDAPQLAQPVRSEAAAAAAAAAVRQTRSCSSVLTVPFGGRSADGGERRRRRGGGWGAIGGWRGSSSGGGGGSRRPTDGGIYGRRRRWWRRRQFGV